MKTVNLGGMTLAFLLGLAGNALAAEWTMGARLVAVETRLTAVEHTVNQLTIIHARP